MTNKVQSDEASRVQPNEALVIRLVKQWNDDDAHVVADLAESIGMYYWADTLRAGPSAMARACICDIAVAMGINTKLLNARDKEPTSSHFSAHLPQIMYHWQFALYGFGWVPDWDKTDEGIAALKSFSAATGAIGATGATGPTGVTGATGATGTVQAATAMSNFEDLPLYNTNFIDDAEYDDDYEGSDYSGDYGDD